MDPLAPGRLSVIQFSLARSTIAALSLANLCLLEVWRQLFSPDQYYFARPRETTDYIAALVALGCLGLLILALIMAAQKLRPRAFFQALVALLTLTPLNLLRNSTPFDRERIKEIGTLPIVAILVVCAALLAPVLWRRRASLFPGLVTVLLAFSPFVLVTTVRTVMAAWNSPAPSAHQKDALRVEPRVGGQGTSVIVLLFDELDNRFINPSTRPADLKLPELDRLRNESTVFENAVRSGPETMIATPALTTGETVERAKFRSFTNLELLIAGRPSRWGDQANLFDLALADGFQVHIVGWYLPYCRIFSVTSCTWLPHSAYFVGQSSGLAPVVEQYLHSVSPFNRNRLALRTFNQIRVEALKQTAHASGLVWVHFPIPHLPQIYDRINGKETWARGSRLAGYLDNVALVDRTLGEIRRQIGPAWDRSAVVLASDHNWLESGTYDGKTSDRVPLYIKLPAPAPHRVRNGQITARILPHIVLGILRGEITDADTLTSVAESGGLQGPLR